MRAPFACTALALTLLACATVPTPAAQSKGPATELPPADRALLQRTPLAVDETVFVNDDEIRQHIPRLLAALKRAAEREGFKLSGEAAKPGDLVLHTSYDWVPPGVALSKPSLFVTVSIDRDGERINESILRRGEGFPGDDAGMDELALELVVPLARGRRTADALQARDP